VRPNLTPIGATVVVALSGGLVDDLRWPGLRQLGPVAGALTRKSGDHKGRPYSWQCGRTPPVRGPRTL
jgi:hypothetical protein